MGRTGRLVAAVVGVGVLFQLVLPSLPVRGASALMAVLLAAVSAVNCVGHLRQSRQARGRARVGWALALLVSVLWSVTNVLYASYAARGVPMVHPGASDYTAMLAICLIPPVLIVLTPAVGGGWLRLRRLIDGATISAALVFVSWRFVVGPVLHLVVPGMRAMVLVAPALEIAGCALALVALARSRPRDGNALILMEASLVVLSVATLADLYNVAFGLARYANGVGGTYLAATLLLTLSSRSSLPSGAPVQGASGDGPWGWLPYLPVGISFGTAAYLQVSDGVLDPVLFWVLLLTAVLVLARQFLNLRTNQDLLRRVDEQRERLAHLAFHDPLTGLANRALLSERATAALADAPEAATTALLLIDLDGFKAVNDTYGHAAGDELLVTVAARLVRCVRADDLVVRLGGDEFVVFMPEVHDIAEAEQIGARLLRELAAPMVVAGKLITIGGSLGLALTHGSSAEPDGLLRDADLAMYEAKAAGKNRLCRFRPPARANLGPPPVEPARSVEARSVEAPSMAASGPRPHSAHAPATVLD